jgi:hypothetical protein
MRTNTKHTAGFLLKIVAGIYMAIILFLFALNGRYEHVGNKGACIDKWRGRLVAPLIDPIKFGK